jgi:ribosomal protein S18 acetylase RimI-like enzyme
VGFGQVIRKSKKWGHAARIIIAPLFRGRGLGRSLCLALIDRANDLNYSHISLNVYRDNPAAIKLYQSIGFHEAKRPQSDTLSDDICYMEFKPINDIN